jgi:hypothetical protein
MDRAKVRDVYTDYEDEDDRKEIVRKMEERAGCARSLGGSLVDSINQLSQAEPLVRFRVPLVVGLRQLGKPDETDPDG